MGTREPKRVGEGAVARVARILAARDIDPGAAMPDRDRDETHFALAVAEQRIPLRYRHAVTDHPQVTAWVRAVAERATVPSKGARRLAATGPSLLLLGTTGTGKTYQVYGAVRALAATGTGVRWWATTEADLYASLRPRPGGDPERELMAVARCPVLILDDLGAAKSSEWTEELLYRLINKRYNDVLPTIITTNLAIRDLRQTLGDRITSRLAEMTERVVLTGVDRRRAQAA